LSHYTNVASHQFVTSMTMLRNAADEASRAGLAYFDLVAHGVPVIVNGASGDLSRALSHPPNRGHTGEPESVGRKRKSLGDGADAAGDATGDVKRRRKRTVKPKDPNAPKKPATPYFLFCTEGRATVKSDMGENADFREVQAELKKRWDELPIEEKKVEPRDCDHALWTLLLTAH
jgi:hypothetical protein